MPLLAPIGQPAPSGTHVILVCPVADVILPPMCFLCTRAGLSLDARRQASSFSS
jgi:hypothetical protein